jgi:sugar phosphate isomerase/epimerase
MGIANRKTGASTCFYGKLDRRLMEEYSRGGVQCIELSFSYNYFYGELDLINRAADIAADAADAGLELWSIHLPFSGELDISHPDAARRNFAMQTNGELIEAAAGAGVKVAVVHPSSEPIPDAARRERLERSRDNLRILADMAKRAGMRLAVENLPRTCLGNHSRDILYLLEVDDLYAAYDTNHLLIQDNVEFIGAVGDRIITLHVSDYDFIDERHWLPLEGKNDWKAIVAALDAAGYDGPWMYEVSSKGMYTPGDLRENQLKLSQL